MIRSWFFLFLISMMSRKVTLFCVILFTGSLAVRDIALAFFLSPITTFVSAEMHQEKETSEKGEKQGNKEKDESKIHSFFASSHAFDVQYGKPQFTHADAYRPIVQEVISPPPKIT